MYVMVVLNKDISFFQVHCVIIDATALSYVDAPGIKSLVAVQRELVTSNMTVLLAGANGTKLFISIIKRTYELTTT
jgi:anti-anti-sigma regulatory factor